MSLFNKKEQEISQETADQAIKQPKPVKQASGTGEVISSIISKDMRITGEMSFKGKARVDGTVDGNVKGEHLILSESGKVMGDLELTSLLCHGSIEGNVKAQQVTAYSSSAMTGNLVATSLTVESGARLNGEVSSSQPPPSQQQPRPTITSTPPKPTETEKKETTKS